MRLVLVCLSLLLVALVGACSSTVPKSYLPVDSPLRAWAAPEKDEPTTPPPAPAPAAKPESKKPAKGATK
jgi:hypothetical protein